MINEVVTKGDNYWLEGFEVSTPQPLTIEVLSGKFNIIHEELSDNDEEIEILETDEYPSFTFNVVSDNLVDVVYDVYLIDIPSDSGNAIHVDRTEMGEGSMAFYTGADKLRFMLMTFSLKPNATSLEDVEIKVNRVVRNNDTNNTEQ